MLVGFSHQKVGKDAARYLQSRGSKFPAVITPGDRRALARTKSFADTMRADMGVDVPVISIPSPANLGDGHRALASLLESHPKTDAVFCGADTLALGALIEARANDVAIPERLRVVGYGDLNFAKDADPPLTTMRIDGTTIGKLAASMLVDRIEGREVELPIVDVGLQLVERASA
jgi:LacI family gluconate utilization system Gnt-I transcriptional repressor